jgi:hypothetical protein
VAHKDHLCVIKGHTPCDCVLSSTQITPHAQAAASAGACACRSSQANTLVLVTPCSPGTWPGAYSSPRTLMVPVELAASSALCFALQHTLDTNWLPTSARSTGSPSLALKLWLARGTGMDLW